jgi:hypothetical protein
LLHHPPIEVIVNRPTRLGFVAFLCLPCLCLPLAAAPKAPIEQSLVDKGRLYEAALLIEKKAPKDAEAQKRAAELYLKLALYDKAAARFRAGGMDEAAAKGAVMASALDQGHRAVAYRYAKALGKAAELASRFAELELAAGRGVAALEWARASGDAALVDRAGKAAYDWTVSAPGKPYYKGDLRTNAHYGPDGRFLVVHEPNEDERIRVVDLQAPRDGQGLAPVRVAAAASDLTSELGYKDEHDILKGWAVDPEGCVLALYLWVPDPSSSSQSKAATYSRKGAHAYQLRLERLDTGLEILTTALGKDFADAKDSYYSTEERPLCFAGDKLCLAVENTYILFDPFTAAIAAKRTEAFATYNDCDWLYAIPGGGGIAAGHGSTAFMRLDASSLAPLEKNDKRENIDRYYPLYGPSSRPPAGYGIKKAADYKAALALAKEFGLMESFASLAGPLLAAGDYETASFVMSSSGRTETEIAGAIADGYAAAKDSKKALEYYAKAGNAARVKALVDEKVAALADKRYDELKAAYAEGLGYYKSMGLDPKGLHVAVARALEKWPAYVGEAVDIYIAAGAPEEAQRLAFDRAAIDAHLRIWTGTKDAWRGRADEWCMPVAKKAGMEEKKASLLMAEFYEGEKIMDKAAAYYRAAGDMKSLRRLALARAKEGEYDEAVSLAEPIGKDALAEIYRVAADAFLAASEYDEALPWLEKLGDKAAVVRIGDQYYKDGRIFEAETYYSKAKAMGWKGDSANAKDAARFAAIAGDLSGLRQSVRLSEDTVKRINSGELKQLWPVPKEKLSDPGYAQLDKLSKGLAALETKPSPKEAARYATYLTQEAKTEMGQGNFAQANLDAELAAWYVYYSKYLALMGR